MPDALAAEIAKMKPTANSIGVGMPCRSPSRTAWPCSASSSRRFPSRSGAIAANPVKFPPGRARLLTKPVPIGSPTAAMTIGIVDVARFAAFNRPSF